MGLGEWGKIVVLSTATQFHNVEIRLLRLISFDLAASRSVLEKKGIRRSEYTALLC